MTHFKYTLIFPEVKYPFKCWTSCLIGFRVSRGQSACVMQ